MQSESARQTPNSNTPESPQEPDRDAAVDRVMAAVELYAGWAEVTDPKVVKARDAVRAAVEQYGREQRRQGVLDGHRAHIEYLEAELERQRALPPT